MNKILIIDKPKGLTSRDVVNKVGEFFETTKVGHTGTLDPIATGVLVITIGKATKISNLITSLEKEYIAECTLGIETDTLDTEGTITKEQDYNFTKEELINVLNSFVGTYNQEVPLYSAIKVNGKKLYEYARNNIKVDIPKREVTIKEIELLEYKDNIFKFRVVVSKGTYIRSLIRDICYKLNTVGIMSNLRRTRQGKYDLSLSTTLDNIKDDNLISIKDALDIPSIEITEDIKSDIYNGHKIKNTFNIDKCLFIDNNKSIAVYEDIDGYLCPSVMILE